MVPARKKGDRDGANHKGGRMGRSTRGDVDPFIVMDMTAVPLRAEKVVAWTVRDAMPPLVRAFSGSPGSGFSVRQSVPRNGWTYCNAMSQGKKIQVSWLTSVI